ncbi:hypothetical protein ACT4UT_29090 [Bacillus sp. B-TM1]
MPSFHPAVGYADTKPVVPNDSPQLAFYHPHYTLQLNGESYLPQNWEKNRRVVIYIKE